MNETTEHGVMAKPAAIESASASTACQTSNSKFAYILTAGVLGVTAAVALGVTLLLFAAVSAWDGAGTSSPDEGYYSNDGEPDARDEWGDDDSWNQGDMWGWNGASPHDEDATDTEMEL